MSIPRELQTIVVATDFSNNATVAVAWAKEIALQHAARLILVHALLPPAPPDPELVPLDFETYDILRKSAEESLAADADELRKSGLDVGYDVVVGPPALGIVDAVEEHRADLLVAGTRGRTRWERLLLGSTALRLVRTAPCPVLTVHPTDAGPPRPARTVLVPTDFSEEATLAAEAALTILGPNGARRLVLLHVYRVPLEAAHLAASALLEAHTRVEQAARAGVEDLAKKLRRPGVEVESIALEGYPPEVILEQAKKAKADVIAMGTHGHSILERLLLGSTTERVLPSAPCPVLTARKTEK